MKLTLGKLERLKSEKIISCLFNKEGESFAIYPLRIIWMVTTLDTPFPAQFTVSVSKKRFKKAVDRNSIKRQIREAYRLNKLPIYTQLEQQQQQVAIMILYTGKDKLSYSEIEERMQRIIKRWLKIQRKKTNSK